MTTNSATITGGTITGITDLAVADGGTGSSSLTLNSVLIGNGTSPLLAVAPSTAGNVLTSSAGAWASLPAVSSFSAGTTGLTPNSSTTGAVTLSGTLAVANGGTGVTSSTGTTNVVLSNNPTLVAPALGTPASGVLTNCTGTANSLNAGIGVNQTWQDVLASRAATTVYTNSSGKPIFVAAWCSNATGNMTLTVGSIVVSFFDPDTSNSLRMTVNGIVPNGSTYFVSLTTNTLSGWSELR
jgi:hypothetical protein